MRLVVGLLVRHEEGKVWRVGLVNESRARLDPVTGQVTKLLDHEFASYGGSVNVSPQAIMEEVKLDQLTPAERKRVDTLRFRSEKTEERVIMNGQTEKAERDERIVIKGPAMVGQPEGKPVARKSATKAATAATQKATPVAKEVEPVVVTQGGPVGQPAVKATATATVSKNKLANKARLAALKAKKQTAKTTKTATGKVAGQPKAKRERKPKQVQPCKCGCGEQVGGHFAQGHDARFKGWMLKIERGHMAVKDLPSVVQKSYEFKKKGDGYVTTTNYKGEEHSGYGA